MTDLEMLHPFAPKIFSLCAFNKHTSIYEIAEHLCPKHFLLFSYENIVEDIIEQLQQAGLLDKKLRPTC